MNNKNELSERGPIDCKNDALMVREGLRVPPLKIDKTIFKKTSEEKAQISRLKSGLRFWTHFGWIKARIK